MFRYRAATYCVDGIDIELCFDGLPHRGRPGLGAENSDPERRLPRIDALPFHFLGDRQHVRRRHHDDVGLEIDDQLHLTLGHAAGHRDHGAAELFGAIVGAQAPGEQAVAVRDVHDVSSTPTGRADRASHDRGPGVDVLRGVADHSRPTRGPARGMDANHSLTRHGEHAKRVVIAQISLDRERKSGQIIERSKVVGSNARGVKGSAVMRDVVVGVPQRPLQAPQLQRLQLVAACCLDALEVS